MNIAKTAVFVVCVLSSGMVPGAVIRVPTDQPTIQAGIDASSNGDTVLVADGTWEGEGNYNLDFGGKAITVKSEHGPETCTIDLWLTDGRGFNFSSSEGPDSVVQGFTISGANLAGPISTGGGAIRCVDASPTIRKNNIWYNTVYDGYGGGIYLSGSSAILIDNIIHGNRSWGGWGTGAGGGIYCTDSSPTIANNQIYNNQASSYGYYGGGYGGGIYCTSSSPLIINNLIVDNIADDYGGGIYLAAGNPVLRHNTIAENSAFELGGGLSAGISSKATDCLIWGNYPDSISGSPAVSYSDIEGGYTGTGNIDVDPLFVSGPDSDYYLSHLGAGDPVDSPCIDAGGDLAVNLCYTVGMETICMNGKTTRRDNHPDVSTVDIGFHHAWSSLAAELTCVPSWGTLPMTCNFGVYLHNQSSYPRTIAGRLDATLASGAFFSHYRAGWTNMMPLENVEVHWPQAIPLLQSVTGINTFQLVAQDVTPAPYNQPPAPPSGDTDQDNCTVVGSQGKTFSSSISAQPASAILPFTSEICVELQNHTDFHRQLAYQVARTLADGTYDPSHRSGYQNVAPHETFTRCWEDSFSDDESSIGMNTYQVIAEDVTPPPYNQPPYPAAGDSGTAGCTVEGITPPLNTWHVDDDNCPGPGSGTPADPFCTIQQGIAAAVDFDTVLVADGSYTGEGNRDLDFGGKRITVRSMNGPYGCIIDCQGTVWDHHRGFYFHTDEDEQSVVQGFTITGGYVGGAGGGGIFCTGSSPAILDCRFVQNTANSGGRGGGLNLVNSSAMVLGCIFSGNQSLGDYGGGGGINGNNCSPTIADCLFNYNLASGVNNSTGGGIRIHGSGTPTTITNSLFAGNEVNWRGGGISVGDGQVTISNCTFAGNRCYGTYAEGGGIDITFSGVSLTVVDSILWGNAPNQIHAVSGDTVTWCDIEGGYPGTGNIDADPLFVPGPAGNYYLSQVAAGQLVDSPCLDAGNDLAANICFTGANGIRCLDQYTTRSDRVADGGQVNLGLHYPGGRLETP